MQNAFETKVIIVNVGSIVGKLANFNAFALSHAKKKIIKG